MGGGNPQITPTPVPYRKLLPLAVIQFVEAFTFTNIFSYVGFMVWDFHLTDDPDQVGYYAGYLGSVFSVASFLSSFWWGRLSDRWGRRPVLLFGCVGGIISSALFGFSKNLTMALVARFLAGALNGNIGVVKGYAADICDKTNQVKGIGVMQLFWGLGGILGPLFGGVLSRPCQNYKGLCSNDSLFGQFPYLVPNLFSCLVGVIALVLLIICLPKEEPRRQGKKVEMEDMKKLNADEFSIDESDPDLDSEVSFDDENGAHLEKGIKDRDRLFGISHKRTFIERIIAKIDKDSVFRNKPAMLSVIAYCILGAAFTMFDEAFPLFALSESEAGGLSASSTDIGIIGAINGLSAVLIQLVIFYPLATRLGFVRLFRLGLFMGTIIFVNYPSTHFFLGNKVTLWASLATITFLKVCVGQFSFSAVSAMISNTTPLSQVGTINGFAMSCVALPRAFSPAIAGNLLAWGFSNGLGFPFNQYLIFVVISCSLGIAFLLSLRLPRSLDYPLEDQPTKDDKKEEKETLIGSDDESSANDDVDGADANVSKTRQEGAMVLSVE